jgi:pimeloyl-ACP methyl ester carboxylesterase
VLAGLLKERAAGKPVYLCGHDLGGALAAQAALDLRVTAPDVQVAKVYGFGATPVGDFRFADLYRKKLENDSYLLMRDVDFARRLRLVGSYEPVPRMVLVRGAPEDDDSSRHSLASYVALLDPSGHLPARVPSAAEVREPERAEPRLTDRESAWLDER